jgi:hypothetical protein
MHATWHMGATAHNQALVKQASLMGDADQACIMQHGRSIINSHQDA